MKKFCLAGILLLFSFYTFAQTWEELNKQVADLYGKGLLEQAIPVAKQAIEKALRDSGELHSDYTASLNNLALVYEGLGQNELAEPLYIRTLSIMKNVSGEDIDYAIVLNGLGMVYYRMGQYLKAETIFIHTLAIQKNITGDKDPDFAMYNNNLALVYTALGQYEKAIMLQRRSVEVFKTSLGEDSREYSTALTNIADLYMRLAKFDTAETLLLLAKEIRKKTLGEEHPDYALILNTLGALYRDMGAYEKAEPIYLQALAIREKKLGKKHYSYATSLNNLAVLYKDMGLYEKALPLLTEAREIFQSTVGKDHLLTTNLLYNLADLYAILGDHTNAEDLIIEYKETEVRNMKSTFYILSEKEKGNYLLNKKTLTEAFNSFLYKYPTASPAVIKEIFNLQILLKSLTLSETRNMLTSVRNSNDTIVQQLFVDWQKCKSLLVKQYSLPLKNRVPGMDSLEFKTENLERELTNRSLSFNQQQKNINTSYSDVRKNLQADEAAIEFVRFRLLRGNRWTDSIMYAAYVLRKEDSVPHFIPLFEEKQLQKLLDSAGKTSSSIATNFYRGVEIKGKIVDPVLGKELYKLAWLPLEPDLKNISKVAYSPSGKLYNIAFHALPIDSITILMNKYRLRQYTSTRQIALRGEVQENMRPVSAYLFGDANFSMDSIQIITQHNGKNRDTVNSTFSYSFTTRGTDNEKWPGLPGTAEEIKKINKLFEQNKIPVNTFSQDNASEENLKAISGHSPGVLHIATHGFFLTDGDKKKNDNTFKQQNVFALTDEPLLRSGLILSGGNYAWTGKTPINGVEDGIVTAYEISQLNLSHTDLVVLSACETALGDIKGSEGVFGLQRAFKMAGVKKLIVSLWQVPDKETAELMTAFYSYWLKGKRIEDAFAQAQADMRKKYPPFYWAAFVLLE